MTLQISQIKNLINTSIWSLLMNPLCSDYENVVLLKYIRNPIYLFFTKIVQAHRIVDFIPQSSEHQCTLVFFFRDFWEISCAL